MKIHISSAWKQLQQFVEGLPERFKAPERQGGTLLHARRNTVCAFTVDGETIVVKRFKRPGFVSGFIYTYLRRTKAQRGYEHAVWLRALGIDSPEPIAWSAYYRHGLLYDSYLVTRHSDYAALSKVTEAFPEPATRPILEAFARFAVRIHEAGVEHKDFNHNNILWKVDPTDGTCRFQLIDINRMRFAGRPLRPRECMFNLRRLACPVAAFLHILDRYGAAHGWKPGDTMLHGAFFRWVFQHNRQIKRRLLRREQGSAHKKVGA